MDAEQIRRVRGFNRTVTQRIGVLHDDYLARTRPLGASRVLWEIEADGSDARSLRTRLGLDSGYLSRLLRMLENERLVVVEPDLRDHRVRIVRLTVAGRSERAELDRLSDDLAWSLLASLDDQRRAQLVEAMDRVERLLTAGLVEISVEDPTSEAAQFCISSYFAELDARFDTGFDPAAGISADPPELIEPAGLLLVARLRGDPIGCGALKFHDPDPPLIKRMWVAPSARGYGVGRRILGELEQHARKHGSAVVRLDTNRSLGEAINLYRSTGYVEVAAFNNEVHAHHWFEKHLPSEDG